MIYGLIFLGHVTASSQEQCEAVQQYAQKNNFRIDKFISFRHTPDTDFLKPGDSVVFYAWNCIGAKKTQLNAFIQYALKNDICIYSATSEYRIDKPKHFKQFLYAFNLYEDIRFNFASGRGVIGIKNQIANGKKPGRIKGSANIKHVWDGKEKKILSLYASGVSMNAISKQVNLSAPTIKRFLTTQL